MALEGPKVQYALTDILDFQKDGNGRVVGAAINQSAAAFFSVVQQIAFGVSRSGPTVSRPTSSTPAMFVGRPFFDTTVNFPIWWDGTQWVNSDGVPV